MTEAILGSEQKPILEELVGTQDFRGKPLKL